MLDAVYPFLFATSFFTFSKGILSSVTWLTFSFNSLLISFVRVMFGILSSLSQIPPENLTNVSISDISPSCASTPSSVLRNCHVSFSFFIHILPTLSFCTSACLTTAHLRFSGYNLLYPSQSRLSIP